MRIQLFDFLIDVTKALLWRHNEAENLQALVNNKQAAIDDINQDFWDDWIVDVFDLTTANDFGLLVWAIILDLPIDISTDSRDNKSWGFGAFRKNFNNGNFGGTVRILNVEEARIVLRLRYYQLICRPTVTQINKILADVFSALGAPYVQDNLDMTATYVFDFMMTSPLKLVIQENDLLPRPSGVAGIILETP